MSGPKSNEYEVLENRRRDERAREQAIQEAKRLEPEARALLEEYSTAVSKYSREALGFAVPEFGFRKVDSLSTRSTAEGYLRQLQALCRHLRSELPAAVGRIEAQRQWSALIGGGPRKLRTAADGQASQPHAAKSFGGDSKKRHEERERRAADIGRVIGRLMRPDGQTLARLNDLGRDILYESSGDRARTLLDELRWQVQHANEEHKRRERDAQDAAALEASLLGLHTSTLGVLRDRLRAAERGEAALTDDFRRRVEEERKEASARADAEYAEDALRETLRDLGYEVAGERFETLFAEGGMVHVRRPGWGEYYVRMRINSEKRLMNSNLIRTSEAGEHDTRDRKLRDVEKETEWCADYQKLREGLAARGIETRALRMVPPGAMEVQKVAPDSLGRCAAKPTTTTQASDTMARRSTW